uniref:Uncharacterized protein n=1 Tax=Sinocyclocheilus anshuiensis TaxID=1608454 RepID=A0A671S5L3_9TELE
QFPWSGPFSEINGLWCTNNHCMFGFSFTYKFFTISDVPLVISVLPEPPAGEILELQDLCAKVSPSQCGPLVLRLRKVMTEVEPEVTEVSRLFRSVLCNFLDEAEEGEARERALEARANRGKSMSVINLRSRIRISPLWSRVTVRRDAEDQAEEDDENEDNIHRNGRIRSMPDISVVEESAPT